MKSMWVLFVLLQIYGAGNVNYQQENGYHEINPIYGKHPSSETVYAIKTVETLAIYGATKMLPRYEKEILVGASSIALGFIWSDIQKGINIAVSF